MSRVWGLLLLVCLVSVQAAWADPSAPVPPLDVPKIVAQQQELRAEAMAKKGRYRDMPEGKRQELIAKQDSVLRTLNGKQSEQDLSAEDRLEMFNSLEWIEATINQAEDDRMVCKREKRTGSHMNETVCKTVAERRKEKEDARRFMDRPAQCTDAALCSGR